VAHLDDEEERLRSAAAQNAQSIVRARQRAEEELLRAKEALRESNERLQAALRAADTGTFRWTLKSGAFEADEGLDRLLAIGSGRHIGTLSEFLSRVHPLERAKAAAEFERCASSGADLEVDLRVQLRDGDVRWLHVRGRTFDGRGDEAVRGGEPIYMTGACIDTTQRQAADAELQENAERLHVALAAARLGDWTWNAHTDAVTLSARAAAIFGVDPSATVTWKTLRELLHVEDRERARVAVERALETHSDYQIEYRVHRADGTQTWVAARGRGIYEPDGSVHRLTGVVQDVSDTKRAEEALREESRVLQVLNDTHIVIAAQLELDALVQTVTDAGRELCGAAIGAFFYNVTDASGESYLLYALSGISSERFAQLGLPRNTPVFNATFHGESVVRSGDITSDPRYGTMAPHFGMPSGHPPVRSYLAVPVVSRAGAVIGGLFFGHPDAEVFTERHERLVVGIAAQAATAIDNARLYEASQAAARERTTLLESERHARTQAERSSQMKDEFLSTLSHELRTPLSAILGWTRVLRHASRTETDLKKGLDTIERNARMQTQLIEDLLDMSRISSGKVRLDVQHVEPAAIVEAAIETLKPAAEARGIRVTTEFDPRVGPVAADPARLQQVLWNLLSNAIKFTPAGGGVVVRLARTSTSVEISVADTGVGIDAEFLPHVFERFRQADASTTRRYSGLGLGLSIVKSLVELHGGTVRAQSDGPGTGATFTLELPVGPFQGRTLEETAFHPAATRPASAPLQRVDLAGTKVLVVDDESDGREVVRRILGESNATVLTAGNAVEALAIVERERPHVIVSDIGMPDVDGIELLRRVRALGPQRGGGTRAVALTAFARAEDRARILAAGFLSHCAKPVQPSELLGAVIAASRRAESER
jgi:PAS domain S-box-containing protein